MKIKPTEAVNTAKAMRAMMLVCGADDSVVSAGYAVVCESGGAVVDEAVGALVVWGSVNTIINYEAACLVFVVGLLVCISFS